MIRMTAEENSIRTIVSATCHASQLSVLNPVADQHPLANRFERGILKTTSVRE